MSLAASYVHRCFLSDIPATILERQRQSPNNSCNSNSNSNIHQRRLHSRDASSSVTANPAEPIYLRLLGTVVQVLKSEHDMDSSSTDARTTPDVADVGADKNNYNNNTTIIVMDDGTGTLARIQTPSAMVAKIIQVQPGMTLECIVRAIIITDHAADSEGPVTTSTTTTAPSKQDPYIILLAHQLVVVQDPHAETLRWLELTYRKALQEKSNTRHDDDDDNQGSTLPSVQSLEQLGYPCSCNNSKISAEELYYIILSDCETEKSNNDSAGSSSNNNNNKMIRGVSLQELSEGLKIPESLLQTLIEDLQLAGQIYRNENGNYLPL